MNGLLAKTQVFFKRNSSTILTCVGAVGVIGTTVLAVKATPKAVRLLDEAKEEKGEELTTMEVVVKAAPAYIPTVITGVATLACIFGANVLNTKQQASLMSAYALLDKSFKEYKKKAIELYGEEANEAIIGGIAKDKYNDKPEILQVIKPPEDFISEEYEKELFFDYFSGRYFESTMVDVQHAEYCFNRNFALRGYANLNEFYEFLGIPPIEAGDRLGWSFEAGQVFYGYSWVDFVHKQTEMDDGLVCQIISMPFNPTADFDSYYGDDY